MKVCFAGGGTLGHVIPALSVINYKNESYEFKKENQIYFIGSSNGVEPEILKKNIEKSNLLLVNMKGFNRKLLGLNIENIKMIKLYIKAKKEIEKFIESSSPDIVIGMGGYISFLAIKVAIKKKIKTIIHEQNACFGLSNKLLINKVNRVLQSFEIKKETEKFKIVGNPRKTEVNLKYNDMDIEKNRTLLVVGGSRGAEKINEIVLSSNNFFEENKIYCTLITGKKYYNNNIDFISKTKNDYLNVLSFSNDLIYHLLYHQIIISRSGATTISEISALNKPCIYIPSPNVTNDHQRKNITKLVNENCAIILNEEMLTKEVFKKNVLELINDKERIKIIRNNLKKQNERNLIEAFIEEIRSVINE